MSDPWVMAFTGTVARSKRPSVAESRSSGSAASVVLKSESGAEMTADLGHTGLRFQEGSRVFLLWGAFDGSGPGEHVYIENLDTGQVWNWVKGVQEQGQLVPWIGRCAFALACMWPIIFFILLATEPVPGWNRTQWNYVAAIISGPASLIFGSIWQSSRIAQQRALESRKRSLYLDQLIECAKKNGVRLEVGNSNLMQLQRASAPEVPRFRRTKS